MCLFVSFKSIEVFSQSLVYTTFFREREDAAVAAGGIHFTPSLLSHSPPLSSCPPVCSSGDRSWQLFVCFSMRVCFQADVPCSVAHLLNVTDHSLFHLINPPPPWDRISFHYHPHHPSISHPLCCNTSAPFITPFTSPIRPAPPWPCASTA